MFKNVSAGEIGLALDSGKDSLVDQAIQLQELGFKVLPIRGKNAKGQPEKAPYGGYGKDHPLPKDDHEIEKIFRRAKALGVILGDRLLVIDADTPEERAALSSWWKSSGGEGEPPITVATPGVDNGGKNDHSNGGHLYVLLPESFPVEASGRAKTMKRGKGYATKAPVDMMRGKAYVLTPYSERTEGLYELVGRVIDASLPSFKWLLDALIEIFTPVEHKSAKSTRNKTRRTAQVSNRTGLKSIEEWTSATSWASIIDRLGWEIEGSVCDGKCLAVRHPESTSAHGLILHDTGCGNLLPPGGFYCYSSSAVAQLDETGTRWSFVVKALYDGDIKRAQEGEGVDDSIDKGRDSRFERAVELFEKNYRIYRADNEDLLEESLKRPGIVRPLEPDALAKKLAGKDMSSNIDSAARAVVNAKIGQVLSHAEDETDGTISPQIRYARDESTGATWINTINKSKTPFIKVDAQGWSIEDEDNLPGKVFFMEGRRSGVISPIKAANLRDIEKLWDFINIPEESRSLVLSWLVNHVVNPHGVTPMVLITGEPGCGKTLTSTRLTELFDPRKGKTLESQAPRTVEGLVHAQKGELSLILGNLQRLSGEMQDALSQGITGNEIVERKLYTNKASVYDRVQITAIATTIHSRAITLDDLRSRIISVYPQKWKRPQNTTIEQVNKLWEESARDEIIGMILSLASVVMRDKIDRPHIKVDDGSRFPEFFETAARLSHVLTSLEIDHIDPIYAWKISRRDIQESSNAGTLLEYLKDNINPHRLVEMGLLDSVKRVRPGKLLTAVHEYAERPDTPIALKKKTWWTDSREFNRYLKQAIDGGYFNGACQISYKDSTGAKRTTFYYLDFDETKLEEEQKDTQVFDFFDYTDLVSNSVK